MEKNCITSVGVVVSHDGNVVPLVGIEDIYGNKSVYFNDDPFGIIEVSGFDDVVLAELDNGTASAIASGLQANMYESCNAIIKVEDGFLIIKDIDDFDYIKVANLGDVITALVNFEDNKCSVEYCGELDTENCEYTDDIIDVLC